MARNSKTFKVNLVTDAVSRSRKVQAIAFRRTLEKQVVIRILRAGLKRVMVNIGYRQLRFHFGFSKGHEFKKYKGAGSILCQCLVDPYADLFSRQQLSFINVSAKDLPDQII